MKRFAICLLAVALVAMISVGPAQAQQIIGKTNLLTPDPFYLRGDGGSEDSLWLHTNLVMPGNGYLTTLTVRNDDDPDISPQGLLNDEVSEVFNLLVLRPTGNTDEYTVIHREQFSDDNPASITGVTNYTLNNLPVQAGDTLAHWWPNSSEGGQNPGAIPFSNDLVTPLGDSHTYFDYEVFSANVEEGDTYAFENDNGLFGGIAVRDMWLNVTFVVPEPGTGVLMALGMISCLAVRSRKRQR